MSTNVTFSIGSTSQTVMVTAEDDNVIENNETFTLSLTSGDNAVDMTPQSATVTITDQTSKYTTTGHITTGLPLVLRSGLTMTFEETSYSVREGASLNVTVTVTAENITFDRDVEVTVMTINGTATGTA